MASKGLVRQEGFHPETPSSADSMAWRPNSALGGLSPSLSDGLDCGVRRLRWFIGSLGLEWPFHLDEGLQSVSLGPDMISTPCSPDLQRLPLVLHSTLRVP